MEQTKNNWIKFVMPVVAVAVILEAIVLISGMAGKQSRLQNISGGLKTVPAAVATEAKIDLVADKTEVEVGGEGNVEVFLGDELGHQVDGVQLYVTYDPEVLELSDLVAGEKLGEPKLMMVSPKKKIAAVMYLVEDEQGLTIGKGERLSLLKFKYLAKGTGDGVLEVRVGGDGDELVTRVAETKTSRAVPFSSNKLVINIK